MLQGVPLTGVQGLRSKRLILLHEKKGPENCKNEVKLRPPLCRPLKHSMIWIRESEIGEECGQLWAGILGVIFWGGGGLKPRKKQGQEIRYLDSADNFPKIRRAKFKKSPHICSAEPQESTEKGKGTKRRILHKHSSPSTLVLHRFIITKPSQGNTPF